MEWCYWNPADDGDYMSEEEKAEINSDEEGFDPFDASDDQGGFEGFEPNQGNGGRSLNFVTVHCSQLAQ